MNSGVIVVAISGTLLGVLIFILGWRWGKAISRASALSIELSDALHSLANSESDLAAARSELDRAIETADSERASAESRIQELTDAISKIGGSDFFSDDINRMLSKTSSEAAGDRDNAAMPAGTGAADVGGEESDDSLWTFDP